MWKIFSVTTFFFFQNFSVWLEHADQPGKRRSVYTSFEDTNTTSRNSNAFRRPSSDWGMLGRKRSYYCVLTFTKHNDGDGGCSRLVARALTTCRTNTTNTQYLKYVKIEGRHDGGKGYSQKPFSTEDNSVEQPAAPIPRRLQFPFSCFFVGFCFLFFFTSQVSPVRGVELGSPHIGELYHQVWIVRW